MIYVATVMSGTELRAASVLERCGFTVYTPRMDKCIRVKGEYIWREEILFDGYVFIAFGGKMTPEEYYKIVDAGCICGFVSKTDGLSEVEAEYIKQLHNSGVSLGMSDGHIENGKLIVDGGVLKQYENQIVKYSRRQRRATVRTTIYGKAHEFTLAVNIKQTYQDDALVDTLPASDMLV